MGNFLTMQELERDAEFKRLAYEDQVKVRAAWTQQNVLPDPKFATLSEADQLYVVRSLVEKRPVFEDDGEVTQWATGLTDKILAGDEAAQKEAMDRIWLTESTRRSIIGNIVAGATSLVEGGESYGTTYGRDGQKITSMLMQALRAAPNMKAKTMLDLESKIGAASFVVNAVEAVVMNYALIGSIGKAGLLTKGLMGPTGRIAKVASGLKGIPYRVVSELGEQTAQSVLSGIMTTAQIVAISHFQDPDFKMRASELGKYVGEEILFDWVAWAALTPVIVGSKAMYRSLVGFDSGRKEAINLAKKYTIEEFTQAVDDANAGKDMAPDFLERVKVDAPDIHSKLTRLQSHAKAHNQALMNKLELPEEKARVIATASGFIMEHDPKGLITLSPVESLDSVVSFGTYDEAITYAKANASTVPTDLTLGRAQDLRVARFAEGVLDPKTSFSPETTRRIISPVSGNVRPENIKFAVSNLVTAAGGSPDLDMRLRRAEIVTDNVKFAKAIPDVDFAQNRITLPSDIRSASMEKRVREYVYRYARAAAGNDPKIAEGITKRIEALEAHIDKSHMLSPGSIESLTYVAKEHLGLDVKGSIFGKIKVGDTEYGTATEAWSDVYAALIDAGKIDFDNAKALVRHISGLTLAVEENVVEGVKRSRYVLRRMDDGKSVVVHDADTLSNLVRSAPQLKDFFEKPKMPMHLGPSIWIIDAEVGTARIQNGMASGSAKSLLEMSNNFFSPKRGASGRYKVKDVINKKDIVFDIEKDVYTVFDPNTGVSSPDFGTPGEAKAYLRDANAQWDHLQHELDARALYSKRNYDGSLSIYDTNGSLTVTHSLEETEAFLGSHPIPDDAKEIFDVVPPETLEAIDKESRKVVGEKTKVGKIRGAINTILRSSTVSQIALPVEAHFADVARRSGNPELLTNIRKFNLALRLVNAKNAQYGTLVDSIWDGISHRDYKFISQLQSAPKSEWPLIAQAFGKKVTPAIRDAIDRAAAFYKSFNEGKGIAEGFGLSHYAPHINSRYASMLATLKPGEIPTRVPDFLKLIYGPEIPRELNLFAENMRLDVFLDAINEQNPYKAMQVYVTQVNKKEILGGALGSISQAFKAIKDGAGNNGLTDADIRFFKDTMLEMLGHKTGLSKRLEEFSVRSSTAFYNNFTRKLFRMPALADLDNAEAYITNDIIGKLNSYFTISTQAARMWAIPRNLTQVTLLGAIIGNNRSWKAFAYVADNKDYAAKLMNKGSFSDTLYKNHDVKSSTRKSLLELSLNPLENSDVITRATAYKAAEDMIDDAYPRYKKGLINKADFLDEISADVLDPPLQKQLLDYLQLDKVDGMKDMLGEKFSNLTMFNYNKGQYGTAFRGVAGRLFGKLGVYPMGALSLYRDILTNGSPARVAARAGRLAATTTALYWAFYSVGIDYRGFLWSDPFEYSGGPYWVLLNDALEAMGSSADSNMAKARFWGSLARTAVPTVFRHTADAAKSLSEGNWYQALLSLATSPQQKQLKEYGVIDRNPFD